MTAQLHATAVLSLLTGAGVTAYDGAVPANPTYPYCVLYFGAVGADDEDDSTPLSFESEFQMYDAQVTTVGATEASVRIYAEKVRTALRHVTPTVTGRSCWPMRRVTAVLPQEDRDVTIPGTATHPLYAVDVYRLQSVPS